MEMHCDDNFVDQFRSFRTDYCTADDLAALGIGDQFDKTFGLTSNDRFSVIVKGVFCDANF
jgi:hypothetical protein